MSEQKECKKCRGLYAAFGFNGAVKVADQHGKIKYGDDINALYYLDFYEDGNLREWPACPTCGWSLGLYSEGPGDRHKNPRAKRLAFFAVVLITALFWAGVYKWVTG